ncbi:hypothetical protein BG004_003731 [Podila humilis]|nr:hypothetical protein BG004_003731 [Podila humilis]
MLVHKRVQEEQLELQQVPDALLGQLVLLALQEEHVTFSGSAPVNQNMLLDRRHLGIKKKWLVRRGSNERQLFGKMSDDWTPSTTNPSSNVTDIIPVLISGAGPVGILAAILLTRLGISVRIIERDRSVPPMSKALSIHARTLEILHMNGLIDRFLASGHPISDFNFYLLGDYIHFAGLVNSISHYNFALFLEQVKTIEILEGELQERCGIKIDRGWELMDTKVVQEESTGKTFVETVIRRALDGTNNTRSTESKVFGETELAAEKEDQDKQYEIQVVRSQYLIGADGGRSVVRHKVPIAFPGRTVPNNMILFDGRIESEIKHSDITVVYGKNNEMFNIFPLSDGQVRIMADGSSLDAGDELTIEKLEKVCQACAAPYTFRIISSSWLTFYKVNERRAATYSHKNRIFLAGDAAHVHSPVGGQDAYNLSWKLALVLNGHAGDELLDTYGMERMPVADDVINMSSRLFTMGYSHQLARRILRRVLISAVSSIIKWITIPPSNVSMLSIRYHENFINKGHKTQPLPAEEYKVGQRAHDAVLKPLLAGGRLGEETTRLHDLLPGPGTFHILVFTSDMLSSAGKGRKGSNSSHTDDNALAANIEKSLGKWRAKWAYGTASNVPFFNVHVVAALPEILVAASGWVDGTRFHADALVDKKTGEGRAFFDPISQLHERYGVAVKGGIGAIVVLRPDSHIAYRVTGASDDAWQDVDSYFRSLFKV